MELRERHILITGANRGIGRAIAKMAAENGAHLHLVSRSVDSELEKEMIDAGALSVHLWPADLGSREGTQKLIEALAKQPIDILINNAGQFVGGLLEEQNMDEIYSMMQVNLLSLIQLSHGLLPGMLARGRGKIVNNASVAGLIPLPAMGTYAATKAAVISFSEGLRLELAKTDVTVLTLITPVIRTRMFEKIEHGLGDQFDGFKKAGSMPAGQYAEMVKEAILLDLSELMPKGMTGIGLKIAKYAPALFRWETERRFRRSKPNK